MKVQVELDEVLRVYRLLESLNELLHQPSRFSKGEEAERYATEQYPEVRELYYDVVWSWLPAEVQGRLTEE